MKINTLAITTNVLVGLTWLFAGIVHSPWLFAGIVHRPVAFLITLLMVLFHGALVAYMVHIR